ncbi:hypothetical protein HPQ64_02090 [Rhizobiales bacterium]|uniref:hypothetical protein n=1 Tax=Hongsoonwoonella zoysiae TaxID=2821844 RepID=UPI001560330D|nr:hypothetical protein [Hongsoonwoonella zoysiae]NRG16472.1 hypothetical protein [Hongsoonwoonella zoysiae]
MIRESEIGTAFDDFLRENGLLAGAEERAMREIIKDQVKGSIAAAAGGRSPERARRILA